MKKLLVTLVMTFVAVSLASAKSYNITLYQPSVVGGTELKPGDYKLEIEAEKVRITNGRQSGEVVVKVQNSERKFTSTTVRYSNDNGKYRVQEIRLGGTATTLVFPES